MKHVNRYKTIFGLTVLMLLVPFFSYANVTQSVQIGTQWLLNQQNPDGSFGNELEAIPLLTVESIITIQTQPNTELQVTNAIDFLNNYTPDNNDYLSRILYATGNNAFLQSLLDSQNSDSGWGLLHGFKSDPQDTALALQALKAVNYPDLETISYTLGYLINSQNEDGGFGFSQGDDASAGSAQSSNVYMTALVLKALSLYSGTFDLQTEIDNTVAYLLTMQNADGAISSDTSTVYETSLAFDALIASDADPSTGSGQVFQNAIDYLINTQLLNGSWNEDPYSTALALRALVSLKPNLTVSPEDISYTPSVPTSGDTVTITATVINIGIADAPSTGSGYITVGFYDGDPDSGVLIGEAVIPDIPQGGSGVASINWTPTTADIYNIFVFVDPQDTIAESNETDNLTVIQIRIYEKVDLLIEGITLIPGLPSPGQTVEAQVKVTNRGDFQTGNVVVRVSLDAIAIGDIVIPTLESMQSAVVTFSLQNLTAGIHQITAAVDPDNLIIESDETNNTLTQSIEVKERIDLVVANSSIYFSDIYPKEGEIIYLSAVVYNARESTASNVAVRFYDGSPDSGGTQIGVDMIIPSIPGGSTGSTEWLPYDTNTKSGKHYIYIVVDPMNVIEETDESNNKAINSFEVSARPDYIIQDILFSPLSPEEGDVVKIKAVVGNIGSVIVETGSKLKFYLGDPASGGQQIGSDFYIPHNLNPGYTYSTTYVKFDTSERLGDIEIYAVVDVYNRVDEINETNNTLSKTLTVTEAVNPDLTITSSDISFTPEMPVTGDLITISAEIRNLKNFPASDITVSFYDGNPASGGILINNVLIPDISGMGRGIAETTWDVTGIKGRHEIYVKIDPDNTIIESNEANNEASTIIKIRLPEGAAPQNLTATPINNTDIELNWEPGPDAEYYGVVGYNIYRNNIWINSLKDISKEGTTSASSTSGTYYAPKKAFDGKTNTSWRATTWAQLPQWWQKEFASERRIKKVAIYWSTTYYAIDFEILTWDGTGWVTQVTVTGNNSEITIHDFPESIITDKVRINITRSSNNYYPAVITEIDIYEDRLIEGLTYEDKRLGQGAYTYYATAVDGDGVESLPSTEAAALLGDAPPAPPIGLTATVDEFRINLNWNANTEPDLLGYRVYRNGLDVAHQGRGAVIVGTNGLTHFSVIDGVTNTGGSTQWDTIPPGTMTIIFPKVYEINRVRMLLNKAADNRFYQYKIESSIDGRNWQTVVDKTTGQWRGWQAEEFAQPIQARYFRITGTYSSVGNAFVVMEFEAYTQELALATLDSVGNPDIIPVISYSNFYEYTYDWNAYSRQPRRFFFTEFNTEEKDVLYIYDNETGVLLASYSGNLGMFVTPRLTAKQYRFQFIADYDGTAPGFKITKLITEGKPWTTYSETIYESNNYYYAVTALDLNGNESDLSEIVTATIGDTTLPATPSDLTAIGRIGFVGLTWTRNTEPDFAGYNLYRDGEATPLNGDTLITTKSYNDSDVTNLTTYTYQITAVDLSGSESPESLPVEATPSMMDIAFKSPPLTALPAQKNVQTEVSVLIENQGLQDVTNAFTVDFYNGNPNEGGVLIESKGIAGLLIDEVISIESSWTPVELISEIFVVIDPDNSVKEYNETNNEAYVKVVAYDNLKTLYTTYVYTLADLVIFGYRDNSHVAVVSEDRTVYWAGILNTGEHIEFNTGNGIFKIYSDEPFSVIAGDPISDFVMGYYALDEKNMGLSKEFYTYMVNFWGTGCKFIVFAYEDNTEVEVINTETSTVIWSGILNKGQHYENRVRNDVSGKFLRVVSSRPVSALTYTDQGYYIPSENGTFVGKLFYSYAGLIGNWPEDINVIAYEDNTRVTITYTDTGEIFWEGILNEGDVFSEHILGYFTVEADKKVAAGVFPFVSVRQKYYHLVVPYDPTGTGVGRLFYIAAILDATAHLFSYEDENVIKVTNIRTQNVLWEGTLYEGDYINIPLRNFSADNSVYKIESSKNLSVIEGYGNRAGADFIPVHYAAVTDLEASNIEILPEEIYPGDNTRINAAVSNMGDTYQENVVVEIYVGDTKISTSSLSLEPHTAAEIQTNWRAIEGEHQIKVVVDPQNSIGELNELNNVISVDKEVLYSQLPSVLPNLKIDSSDIVMSSNFPVRGETLTISAAVHNTGADANDILVLIYLGDPLNGGIQIGLTTIPELLSNSETIIQTEWIVDKPAGTYDIYIWVDPYNTIPEENEDDNIAFKTITVKEKEVSVDVTTDSSQYQANSDVGITVFVENNEAAPWSGTGEVYIEDPSGNEVAHVGTFTVDDLYLLWSNRIKLTIDHTQIDDDLTDFPVPIHLSTASGINNADVSGIFDELGANSKKIAIITSDGQTQSYVEIERWDEVNKEAELWVNVPFISSSADTVLYLYYDSVQADNTTYVGDTGEAPAENVWDSNYKAVYHMSQDPSGNSILDSTSNVSGGTSYGNMTSSDLVDGQVGKAIDFDGVNDYLQVPGKSLVNASSGTIEMWFKPATDSGNHHLFYVGENGDGFGGQNEFHVNQSGSFIQFVYYNGSEFVWNIFGRTLQAGQWHHVAAVWDSGAGMVELFLDGSSVATGTYGSINFSPWRDWIRIGRHNGASFPERAFSGTIDEVVISQIAYSDAWIKASYQSQSDNLISFGSAESLVSTQTYTFIWNTGSTPPGDYKVHVTLSEGQGVIAEGYAPFEILPDIRVDSKVVADKISYNANETVTITSTVTSLSENTILENLSAIVSVTDSSGLGLYTETNTIPILTLGQLVEFMTYWNTDQNPPGIYSVTLEVLEGITTLSISTAAFDILGTEDTGEGITGTITASPDPVYQGQDETLTYTITNNGNEDINNLDVRVLIVDPETEEIKTAISSQLSVNRGETITEIRTVSTLTLSPRIYLVILQAVTSTMPEPKTLDSTTFEVMPSLEITKTIPDLKNILVWLNYPCIKDSEQSTVNSEQQDCINQTLIEQALNEAGVNYYIVLDKKDFQTEMRNPYYTDFLILGDHNPIEDHFSEELREQVYSGKGLISSMFHRQNLDEEVFGIEFRGYLSDMDYLIELTESEISTAGDFQSYGRAKRVEVIVEAENILGWIVETTDRYPGIIKNEYGDGNVLFFGFDLGLSSQNYELFEALLGNSLSYIHTPPDTTAFHPNELVPVEIEIKSLGGVFDLRITETYPEGIKLYDPSTGLRTGPLPGEWITDNPWIVELHLEPDETKTVLYYALTPDTAGTYTLETEVGYIEDEIYNYYQNLSIEIVVEKDADTMAGDIITELNALVVTGQDRAKVNNAVRYMENVQERVIVTDNDIEKNIHDILKAIGSLLSVTSVDIADIRLMMDDLLEVWEGRYYFSPDLIPVS